jgi:hypothetical protein
LQVALEKGSNMFKLKQIFLVATSVGGFAMVATASIFTGADTQKQGFAVTAQIDTLDLMAKAGHLPVESVREPF